MKKEYIIYKLSEEMKNATRIENELFKKFDVKRGLRNEDGTGVLVGSVSYTHLDVYKRQDNSDVPENTHLVSKEVQAAFNAKYPQAKDVEWELKGDYAVCLLYTSRCV